MPLHLASPNSPRINASTEREHRDESAPKELGAAKAGAEREADHRAEERADEPIDLSIARDGGALSEKGPAQAPTGSHEPIKEMKAIEGQIEDKQMVEVEDETKHAVKSERAQGKQPLRDEGTDDDLCLVAPPSAPLATGEDGGEDSDDEVHFQGRAGSVALSDFPCAAARSHLPHIRPLFTAAYMPPLTCKVPSTPRRHARYNCLSKPFKPGCEHETCENCACTLRSCPRGDAALLGSCL